MKSHFTLQILNWIRSQVVGIFIAIIAILVATVYAAPYSPSATGYAKYDVSCTSCLLPIWAIEWLSAYV